MKFFINKEVKQYPAIVVDNPMAWASPKHNSAFDLATTWESLKAFPISRISAYTKAEPNKGIEAKGTLLFFLCPGEEVRNAMTVIESWGFHYVSMMIVRREDGSLQTGLWANKGENVTIPAFKSPLDVTPIRTVLKEIGGGGYLFGDPKMPSYEWWMPDRIDTIFDLWDYPFRPKNFTLDQETIRIAQALRELIIDHNKYYWRLGDLINLAEKQNIALTRLPEMLGLADAPSYRWLWEMGQVAAAYPEPVRDYTVDWTTQRRRFTEKVAANKKKKKPVRTT